MKKSNMFLIYPHLKMKDITGLNHVLKSTCPLYCTHKLEGRFHLGAH